MTTTYLALTKGSSATDDTHRQIILTALFRNSSGGIVKNDAGSPPSLAAILARGDGRPYGLAIVLRQGLQREAGEHGKGLQPLGVQNKDPLLVAQGQAGPGQPVAKVLGCQILQIEAHQRMWSGMMGAEDAAVATQKRMRPGGDQGHRRGGDAHVQMPQGFNIVLNLPTSEERSFGGTGIRRAPELTQELIFSCDAIGKIGHAQETEIKVFLIAGEEALVFRGFDLGDRQNGQTCQIQRLPRCSAVSLHLLIVVSHAGHAFSQLRA